MWWLVGVLGVARQPEMGAVRAAELGLATAAAALPPSDAVGWVCFVCRSAAEAGGSILAAPTVLDALWCCMLCLSCGLQVPLLAFSNVTRGVPQATGCDVQLTGRNRPPPL